MGKRILMGLLVLCMAALAACSGGDDKPTDTPVITAAPVVTTPAGEAAPPTQTPPPTVAPTVVEVLVQSPAPSDAARNEHTENSRIVLVIDGAKNPLTVPESERDLWRERYNNVRLNLNVTLVFNEAEDRADEDMEEEERESTLTERARRADIIKVNRQEMVELAAAGLAENISDGLLSYGLPEAYYQAGWLNSALYGFTIEPLTAEGFLIYNNDLIRKAGMSPSPGEMFDGGHWSWEEFLAYCTGLRGRTKDQVNILSVDVKDWFFCLIYADGGYLFHPETSLPLYGTKAVKRALEFTQELAKNDIIRKAGQRYGDGTLSQENESGLEAFLRGDAVFFYGGVSELGLCVDSGMNVGAVPIPWGPDVKINTGFSSVADMLPSNYRTMAVDAELFVLVKGGGNSGALSKTTTKICVDVIINYYAPQGEEILINRGRERLGMGMVCAKASALAGCLAGDDYARIEWYVSRPAVLNPADSFLTEGLMIVSELEACVFQNWDATEWLKKAYDNDLVVK